MEEDKNKNMPMTQSDVPMGFEDDDEGDFIIPRVKVINALSPERKEKIADEGDILNSLTKEKINGSIFVPVFKYSSNILWRERNLGGGIICQSKDGKTAIDEAGGIALCSACKKNLFDNTKQGRDAIPTCTKYMNFFGFIAGQQVPIILSFARTNYGEGKKLYSLAKVSLQNMWNHGYALTSKLVKKNDNEWYIIDVLAAGVTSSEDRELGAAFFRNFRGVDFIVDSEENYSGDGVNVTDEDLEKSEY